MASETQKHCHALVQKASKLAGFCPFGLRSNRS